MLDRFKEHLCRAQILPQGARVLVGYSGGGDSTCLLHLLHELRFEVVAGHLHHGQRPEADDEAARCEAFCDSLGIPFASGRADVPKLSKDLKIGLEESGRRARYEFLESLARRVQCDFITTGHTRDDQVETIIFNLARGTGLAGLSGIPERRGNIVRPLLPFTRAETRAYCSERAFWTHEDPNNSDLKFSRARIRQNVLAELRAINADVDAAILRNAEIAKEENQFLDGMAAAALERCEAPLNGELSFLTADAEVSFERDRLSHLPPVLMKRAFRLVAKTLGATLDFTQCEALFQGLTGKQSGSVTCEGGEVVFEWASNRVGARILEPIQPFRFNLTIPGETISEEFGWSILALESSEPGPLKRASLQADIDRDRTKGALFFRSAKAGDEMRPLGFSGHRKVADLMSEAGLTATARGRLPVVCDMMGPIWIPGVCLDERVGAGPDSSRSLHLRFSSASKQPNNDRNGAIALSVR